MRAARQQANCLYLTRPGLLPNPHRDTPWQIMFANCQDRAFITTMGFDVVTFEIILHDGFCDKWNLNPIPRQDTQTLGKPRLGAQSLDAAGALGLTLHYLNLTMRQVSLHQILALIPSTVSRYINFSLDILLETL